VAKEVRRYLPIVIGLNGIRYYGSYKVVRGMITVLTGAGGYRYTEVGTVTPETRARMLLKEIVLEVKP
jgi:hypothetical protein